MIYYIREIAMKCKVDLIKEIKSNIKLMVRRTKQTISHRKENECLAKERIKLKKVAETVVYNKSDTAKITSFSECIFQIYLILRCNQKISLYLV